MPAEHGARGYPCVRDDALHPFTIAQSETNFWLRSEIGLLAEIRRLPETLVDDLAARMSTRLAPLVRRRIAGKIEVSDIGRLLSLPVWTHRYETYGVWIATRIVASIDDHDVMTQSDDGRLKFGFREAMIAEVKTAYPTCRLFAERREPLTDPIGQSRKSNVQPDFSI